MLNDSVPAVVKRTIGACTVLFKEALVLVSKQPDCSQHKALWKDMLTIRSRICGIASEYSNDGVRVYSLKFVESLILLYTSAYQAGQVPAAGVTFDAALLPADHPLLNAKSMTREAEAFLMTLLDKIPSQSSIGTPKVKSIVLIVLLNCVSNLALSRASLFPVIVPRLIEFCKYMAESPMKKDSAWSSLVHNLKNALSGLVKCKFDEASQWRERVVKAMHMIGAGEQAETARRHYERDRARTERQLRDQQKQEAREREAQEQEQRSRVKRSAEEMAEEQRKRARFTDGPMQQNGNSMYSTPSPTTAAFAVGGQPAPGAQTMPQADMSSNVDHSTKLKQSIMANVLKLATTPNRQHELDVMINQLPPDILADIVIFNMQNIGSILEASTQATGTDLRLAPSTTSVQYQEQSASAGRQADQGATQRIPKPVAKPEKKIARQPVTMLSADERAEICQDTLRRLVACQKDVEAISFKNIRIQLLTKVVGKWDAEGREQAIKTLLTFILGDYVHRNGHEIAEHLLYDAFSRTPGVEAASGTEYHKLLMDLVEGIAEKLSPRNKSLPNLLLEAPMVTPEALAVVERLCNADIGAGEPQMHNPSDWVTLGLSTMRDLIMNRPVLEKRCLDVCLACAVHENALIRDKAIRLVANQLFPFPSCTELIEDFACSQLDLMVREREKSNEDPEAGQAKAVQHEEKSGVETPVDESSQIKDEMERATLVLDVTQKSSLFFALCVKKQALVHMLALAYAKAPDALKEAMNKNIGGRGGLASAFTSKSPALLQLVKSPVTGAENFLLVILQNIGDSSAPSRDLAVEVLHLYGKKKDPRFLIPVLGSLKRDEIIPLLPTLVKLPEPLYTQGITNIVSNSGDGLGDGFGMTAPEVLTSLHGIPLEPPYGNEPTGLKMKVVAEAINRVFKAGLKPLFPMEVLASALQQLVAQNPIPLLFMRTVILSLQSVPKLQNFVLDLLTKLVQREVWSMTDARYVEGLELCVLFVHLDLALSATTELVPFDGQWQDKTMGWFLAMYCIIIASLGAHHSANASSTS
eukprot:scaffold1883_cov396-Prasinococcus_capsulatus_cf.AAC.5